MLSFKAKRSRSSNHGQTTFVLDWSCIDSWLKKKKDIGAAGKSLIFKNQLTRFTVFYAVYLFHNVVHGSQATPVYTLMLRCSQNAPPSIRTACYSFLGTLEILGKQLSLFMAGVLTESFGYVAALNISLVVSFFVVFLVWYCPKHLRWSYKVINLERYAY